MDTLHLNTYLDLIEALLQCARGEEWLLLQQHEQLVDAELVGVMAQVTEQLHQDGNLPAAKFLHYWTAQLTHLLQQNFPATTSTNSHVQSPVSQEVAAQAERQSCAVKAAAPAASPPAKQNHNNVNGSSIDPAVEITKQQLSDPISPQVSNRMEELLANISSQLEQLATSIDKHQNPANPLWYMSILEQADAQGWIVSSEEVEQLIGTKPHCAPDRSSFMRGCWKFEKAGKVGIHSAWRVTKEMLTPSIGGVGLPSGIAFTPAEAALRNHTPQPDGKLELDLSSPWAEK